MSSSSTMCLVRLPASFGPAVLAAYPNVLGVKRREIGRQRNGRRVVLEIARDTTDAWAVTPKSSE